MGLFNWGKKKKTQGQEINEAFAAFGAETNEVKQPGKESRKETAEKAEKQRQASIKKEQILEKMNALRKTLYGNPSFSDHCNTLEDAIDKLKHMGDNADIDAMASVDNFMLKAITDGINYCNRNNWVGMGACLDIIGELINDRFSCGAWYKDPEYIKARLTSDQIYVEIKNLESRITTLKERGATLKEKYVDPRFKAQMGSIGNEMVSIQNEIKSLGLRIENLNKENTLLKQTLGAIETRVSNELRDQQFDIQEQVDGVMEMQAEANARNYAIERMNDKLNSQSARHTDSNLTVDATMGESTVTTAPQIDLNSFDF